MIITIIIDHPIFGSYVNGPNVFEHVLNTRFMDSRARESLDCLIPIFKYIYIHIRIYDDRIMPSFTSYAGLSSKSPVWPEAPSSSEKHRLRRDEPKALVLEAGAHGDGAMGMGRGMVA